MALPLGNIAFDCGKLPVSYFKADYIKQKLHWGSLELDSVNGLFSWNGFLNDKTGLVVII